jgi:hypothetical protein
MARRTSPVPVLTSAVVTAAVSLWILIAEEGRRPPAGRPPAAASPVPFVDFHNDVAHDEDLLSRSTAAALRWMERHQDADGSWSASSYTQECVEKVCPGRGGEGHDVGITALAALSIIESGQAKKYEDSVRRALAWLAARQDELGGFGPRMAKSAYGHAIATLAFARAVAVLDDPSLRPPAVRGARALEMSRNPGFAWRYGARDGQNDSSVTAWSGAALLAAASPEVRIPVDPVAFDGIRRWLSEVTNDRGEVSYMRRGAASSSVRGLNDRFERNEGLTAAALCLRLEMGEDRRHPELATAAKRLMWNLPVWTEDGASVDYMAWFSGTRALAAWNDRELWSVWSARVLKVVALHQRRFNEGCLWGSWDPVDKWGFVGGRVYSTSMNLLTLGVLGRMRMPDQPKGR